jgi:hypothetical protein
MRTALGLAGSRLHLCAMNCFLDEGVRILEVGL